MIQQRGEDAGTGDRCCRRGGEGEDAVEAVVVACRLVMAFPAFACVKAPSMQKLVRGDGLKYLWLTAGTARDRPPFAAHARPPSLLLSARMVLRVFDRVA